MEDDKHIYLKEFKTPVGELILGVFQDEVCLCDWKYRRMRKAIDQRISSGLEATFLIQDHPFHLEVIQQIEAYFSKKINVFQLPIRLVGTPFQQQVWETLLTIPYGETVSYLALAEKIDNKSAVRAVASANGANALSLIVPCHRVIGSDKALVGYAGGLPAKKKLLELESKMQQLELF